MYFKGIGLFTKHQASSLAYRVFSIDQLEIIIEHFDKYPLQTKKRADFELFKSVVAMVKQGKHKSIEGLQEIVNYRASLNNGLTSLLKESFPNSVPVPRLIEIDNPQIPDPY